MSKEPIKGTPIDNLLYTTEDKKCSDKTKAELEVPDPSADKAVGILKGNEEQPKVPNES